MNIKKIYIFLLFFNICSLSFAQEALKSVEEEYYDFLSLTGLTQKPTLGYRTLSDSKWDIKLTEEGEKNNPWHENNLGTIFTLYQKIDSKKNIFTKGIDESIKIKAYGPDWFNSFNSAVPYGQNDGALWQGKGYNTAFTAGLRMEAYGFEVTVKPNLSFSQNLEFELVPPNYQGSSFAGKASDFGYYGVRSVDAPQRFGNTPFWTFDWGDSEIRWTWKNFTLGFGMQSPWLGPAQLNPIIHSNNSASYPKIDFGLRKTQLYMPHFGWDLGKIEFRTWWGKLEESKYFDLEISNDNNLLSGFSINWQVPYFSGLTLGLHRTMLSKWEDINIYTTTGMFIPWMSSKSGEDESDQRASFTCEYLIEKAGFNLYFEWARNDFQAAEYNFLRYPFHTEAYNIGLKKAFTFGNSVKGLLAVEITQLGCSQDYTQTYSWFSTFYAHHKISQGYTQKGQWLGAGIGTGGNSQYISFTLFYPRGKSSFSVQRINPDLDYVWFVMDSKDTYSSNMYTLIDFSIKDTFFFTKSFLGEAVFSTILDLSHNYEFFTKQIDFHIELSVKYII